MDIKNILSKCDHTLLSVTATEEDMREYGNSNMAKHKVPRYFIFVKEFPMNAAGKILKYKIKTYREEGIMDNNTPYKEQ